MNRKLLSKYYSLILLIVEHIYNKYMIIKYTLLIEKNIHFTIWECSNITFFIKIFIAYEYI